MSITIDKELLLDKIKVFEKYPSYEKLSSMILLTKQILNNDDIDFELKDIVKDKNKLISFILNKIDGINHANNDGIKHDHSNQIPKISLKPIEPTKNSSEQLLYNSLATEFPNLYRHLSKKKTKNSSTNLLKVSIPRIKTTDSLDIDLDILETDSEISEEESESDIDDDPKDIIEIEKEPEITIEEDTEFVYEEDNNDDDDDYSD